MNAEKLKKELGEAVKLAWSIHGDMVDIIGMTDTADATTPDLISGIDNRLQEAVSSMANLAWYLEHISEGVSA